MSGLASGWSGLLVSVRDADEAAAAVGGGAAIVDVKEPARGPLGAAAPETVAAVAGRVAGRRPWTLACGELAADPAALVHAAVATLSPATPSPMAAKAGPAGLDVATWRRRFVAFAGALPEGVEPVAVAYADWTRAAAPRPEALVAAAAAVGCRTLLIDTFDKSAAGIMESGSASSLPAWIDRARAAGMAVAVAGRLARSDAAGAVAAGADVVAIRSAACRAGRWGRVDRDLVAAFAATVAAAMVSRDRHTVDSRFRPTLQAIAHGVPPPS